MVNFYCVHDTGRLRRILTYASSYLRGEWDSELSEHRPGGIADLAGPGPLQKFPVASGNELEVQELAGQAVNPRHSIGS